MTHNKTILLFDNSSVTRSIIKGITQEEYTLIESATLRLAVSNYERNKASIDIIILSENVDYKEFLAIDDFTNTHAGVVLVGSLFTSSVKTAAKALGVKAFVEKPLIKNDFLDVIARVNKNNVKRDNERCDHVKELNIMSADANAFGSLRINFNKGTMYKETGFVKSIFDAHSNSYTYNELVEELSKYLIKDDKKQFIAELSFTNVKNTLAKNNVVKHEALFEINGKNYYLVISVYNIADETSTIIQGLLVINDRTKEYLNTMVTKDLFEKEYDLVVAVDLSDLSTHTVLNNDEHLKLTDAENNYDALIKLISEVYFTGVERRKFTENAQLSNVLKNIEQADSYDINTVVSGETMSFYKFSFKYIDEFKKSVVLYVDNITHLKDADYITGALNYHGFLNKTYEIIKAGDSQYSILYLNCENYQNVYEFVAVDTVMNFLQSLCDVISCSFLKPLCIGRSTSDNMWLLVDDANLDCSRLSEFSSVALTEGDKHFLLNIRFGICRLTEKVRKSKKIDVYCERARLTEQSIEKYSQLNYAIFDDELRDDVIVTSTLLNDLADAFDKDEFQVYYQPIFDINGRRILCAEALVRWIHGKYGIIRPDIFIPLLESNGIISKVDDLVINKVDKCMSRIPVECDPFPISVNLSRLDFYDEKLVKNMLKISAEHTVDSSRVNFEVTESYYWDLSKETCEILNQLKINGSQIYLDDFGDGASSFKSLISNQFNVIKIYKGMIDQIGVNKTSEKSIKYIIQMAHSLKMRVIAEGVETKQQVKFLKSVKCDMVQGYYYAKPMPESDFVKLAIHKIYKKN